jgi:hypothetical protein
MAPVSLLDQEPLLDPGRFNVPYHDLGPDWNNRRRSTEQQTRRLVRQLERLGVNVTIEPIP